VALPADDVMPAVRDDQPAIVYAAVIPPSSGNADAVT
jgi:hypothetical protein